MINVDASEAPRRLIHATMQFPVKPGPMSLLYPKWIPGEHGPTGPIEDLAGMKITANGQPIRWRSRSSRTCTSFMSTCRQGVSTLDVAIEFISPPDTGGFSSGSSITSQLAVLSWNQFLLYPKGAADRSVAISGDAESPGGLALWHGAADRERIRQRDRVQAVVAHDADRFARCRPALNYKTVDLSPGGTGARTTCTSPPTASAPRASRMKRCKHYRNLVKEANRCSARTTIATTISCYTLSDHVAHFGLEHHESSDDRTTRNWRSSTTDHRQARRRPAAARVRAFVERQVPASGRTCYAGLQRTHEGRICSGCTKG